MEQIVSWNSLEHFSSILSYLYHPFHPGIFFFFFFFLEMITLVLNITLKPLIVELALLNVLRVVVWCDVCAYVCVCDRDGGQGERERIYTVCGQSKNYLLL